jgi:hypothetical protein
MRKTWDGNECDAAEWAVSGRWELRRITGGFFFALKRHVNTNCVCPALPFLLPTAANGCILQASDCHTHNPAQRSPGPWLG